MASFRELANLCADVVAKVEDSKEARPAVRPYTCVVITNGTRARLLDASTATVKAAMDAGRADAGTTRRTRERGERSRGATQHGKRRSGAAAADNEADRATRTHPFINAIRDRIHP